MDELLDEHARELPKGLDRGRLRKELADEVLGLGPARGSARRSDRHRNHGRRSRHHLRRAQGARSSSPAQRFSSEDALRSVIERIVTPLGRRIDESTPMVDARLKDGSRVNAIIPPLALRGPCLTIRKFSSTQARRRATSSTSARSTRAWRASSSARSSRGATSSSPAAPARARRRCSTSCRRPSPTTSASSPSRTPPSCGSISRTSCRSRRARRTWKASGEYSIRDLVRNALRMRPDRIVVGECRGGEALDMLQAMNTGHDGSLDDDARQLARRGASRASRRWC